MIAAYLPSAEYAAATGALRVGPAVLAAGAATGLLAGTATVTKDLFDVAGQRIAAGNPDWLAVAPPAAIPAQDRTDRLIQLLLKKGIITEEERKAIQP